MGVRAVFALGGMRDPDDNSFLYIFLFSRKHVNEKKEVRYKVTK